MPKENEEISLICHPVLSDEEKESISDA